MKLLLDSCVWGKSRVELEAAGHEVIWAGDWERDPGDMEIMARAHQDQRILVTLDKDFGELAIVKGLKHSGIIRLVNLASQNQAKACLSILDRYMEELQSGAIITVEMDRVRVRPPNVE